MRFFTPEEANRLIPDVTRLVSEILEKKALALSAGSDKSRLERELESAVQGLESLGCILRDIEQGLVDFPALRLGAPVYLCWRMGEPEVAFWHGEEGFSGRKPIERSDFVDNAAGAGYAAEPVVEVIDFGWEIRVLTQLPGMRKRDVKVGIAGEELRIYAERGLKRYFKEVQLPHDVDAGTVHSRFKNGILEFVLAKEKPQPTKTCSAPSTE